MNWKNGSCVTTLSQARGSLSSALKRRRFSNCGLGTVLNEWMTADIVSTSPPPLHQNCIDVVSAPGQLPSSYAPRSISPVACSKTHDEPRRHYQLPGDKIFLAAIHASKKERPPARLFRFLLATPDVIDPGVRMWPAVTSTNGMPLRTPTVPYPVAVEMKQRKSPLTRALSTSLCPPHRSARR